MDNVSASVCEASQRQSAQQAAKPLCKEQVSNTCNLLVSGTFSRWGPGDRLGFVYKCRALVGIRRADSLGPGALLCGWPRTSALKFFCCPLCLNPAFCSCHTPQGCPKVPLALAQTPAPARVFLVKSRTFLQCSWDAANAGLLIKTC